ncbi:type I restriction enyme HindI endonuclease subunit-like [Schistocerca gregaria]|uniref:type I restriction enyme HindI endonuclease subunit-like n=1 Tax=Schistocerca gregaria TaxID=7010 RepID=UPI00211E5592|nr:type I restriction enyme HindI endonuclease subunit-like [Schistocerca gregaria]
MPGCRDPYYDLIVVLSDRILLEDQLADAITSFLSPHKIFDCVRSKSSSDLSKLLVGLKFRIVITTIQKFLGLSDQIQVYRAVAIIVDEAHRSHGKSLTRKLHRFLTGESRQSRRITYFSFTCTPNANSLEMFGVRRDDTIAPFYTYSMKEAVEDRVILDVLGDYTTVTAVASVSVRAEAREKIVERGFEATRALFEETSSARCGMEQKAKFVVSHLVRKLQKAGNGFCAKAMLVVPNRPTILEYKLLIEKEIELLPAGQRFAVVACFAPFFASERCEAGSDARPTSERDERVNGVYHKDALGAFKDPGSMVKLVVVADKLRTGFDEPMLSIMYIDRKLSGEGAVQTIGRLSRIASGKTQVCVVDFVNSRSEIVEAFRGYWGTTTLSALRRPPVEKAELDSLASYLNSVGVARSEGSEGLEKRVGRSHLEACLLRYCELCDRLQTESGELSYRRAMAALKQLECKRASRAMGELIECVNVSVLGLRVNGSGKLCIGEGTHELKIRKQTLQALKFSSSPKIVAPV